MYVFGYTYTTIHNYLASFIAAHNQAVLAINFTKVSTDIFFHSSYRRIHYTAEDAEATFTM